MTAEPFLAVADDITRGNSHSLQITLKRPFIARRVKQHGSKLLKRMS